MKNLKITALFSLLMVLILACVPALGEGAGKTTTYDFDDFTLTLDASIALEKGEKASQAIWFMYYPGDQSGQARHNVNCVWVDEYTDLEQLKGMDLNQVAESYMSTIEASLKQQNLGVKDLKVLSSEMTTLGGRTAYAYSYSMNVDYKNVGMDMVADIYTKQVMVSDENFRTYLFTATSVTEETMEETYRTLDTILFK